MSWCSGGSAEHLAIALPEHTNPKRQRGTESRRGTPQRAFRYRRDKRLTHPCGAPPRSRYERIDALCPHARGGTKADPDVRETSDPTGLCRGRSLAASKRKRSTPGSFAIGATGYAAHASPAGRGRAEGAQHAITHIRPLEHLPVTRSSNAAWKRAARTKFAFTFPKSAIRSAAKSFIRTSRASRRNQDTSGAPRQRFMPPN